MEIYISIVIPGLILIMIFNLTEIVKQLERIANALEKKD